jgi:hypothetical protein
MSPKPPFAAFGKKQRRHRKALGVCINCAGTIDPERKERNLVTCANCSKRSTVSSKAYRARQPTLAVPEGACRMCYGRKPIEPERFAAGLKSCADCAEKHRKRTARYRKALLRAARKTA